MCAVRLRQQTDADVIIAGAGPAGATAAATLAGAGFSVIALDSATFPRDKVCGDFVGPAALLELHKLGITQLGQYRKTNIIREATLYLDGKQLINHPIPEVPGMPAHGRVIPRQELDDLIYKSAVDAGATTLERTRITDYQTRDDGVHVNVVQSGEQRVLSCRLLLGADGIGSVVARGVRGGKPSRLDRIIAVRAYYEGVPGPADRAELYFTSGSFPGYYWLFPTSGGGANVGVGLLLETLPEVEAHPRDLLMQLVAKDPALKARLGSARLKGKVKGWPLVTYNHRTPLVADRVMLLGDAAGLINPLNGEGIQYAMQSGRWAAQTAALCLRRDDLSHDALEPYAERVAQALRYDMALAGMIVQLIRNRSLNPVWLHALKIITTRAKADPQYATTTGGVLAGLVEASAVLRPDILIGTARQAAFTEAFAVARHAVRGPKHWAQFGKSSAKHTASLVWENVRHPVALAQWGGGVASCAAELVSQVGANAMRQRKDDANEREAAPPSAAPPPTVRVRSYTSRSVQ
jgi:geranylgeranyl reductase family protein